MKKEAMRAELARATPQERVELLELVLRACQRDEIAGAAERVGVYPLWEVAATPQNPYAATGRTADGSAIMLQQSPPPGAFAPAQHQAPQQPHPHPQPQPHPGMAGHPGAMPPQMDPLAAACLHEQAMRPGEGPRPTAEQLQQALYWGQIHQQERF